MSNFMQNNTYPDEILKAIFKLNLEDISTKLKDMAQKMVQIFCLKRH